MARIAPSLASDDRRTLERSVRDLADALAALASDLGDRETRQRAADRASEVATAVSASDSATDSTLATGVIAVRMLAIDLMVFAGVDLDAAVAAVREGILEHRVPAPAPAPRGPVGWLRTRRRTK